MPLSPFVEAAALMKEGIFRLLPCETRASCRGEDLFSEARRVFVALLFLRARFTTTQGSRMERNAP